MRYDPMAHDAVRFIRALGFDQVDLFDLSMGGFIAQVIAEEEPRLVRKVILAGTGPAGGPAIDKVPASAVHDPAGNLTHPRAALSRPEIAAMTMHRRHRDGTRARRRWRSRAAPRRTRTGFHPVPTTRTSTPLACSVSSSDAEMPASTMTRSNAVTGASW